VSCDVEPGEVIAGARETPYEQGGKSCTLMVVESAGNQVA